MSEHATDCDRFESLLLEGISDTDWRTWSDHLEDCPSCRQQWTTHQMLVAVFAEEPVPDLSTDFAIGLQRRMETAIEVKPLAGWRTAAMIAYTLTALLLLGWVFTKFPLPSISVDPASPWTLAVAIAAVPVTLWLTIGITRWLPSGRTKGFTQLSLL